MLSSLLIRQIALIEDLRIEFERGLNVITGETGAGKSIVIDALSLALGERADTSMLRDGAAKAVVEAEFSFPDAHPIRAFVEAEGAEWQPVLILRRELSSKGVSRCFVNDSPVSVAVLHAIGDRLVDIHGQHEHQSLLHAENHINTLDAFGNLFADRAVFEQGLDALRKTSDVLRKAYTDRDRQSERTIVLEQQLRDLGTLNAKENEDEEIERELRISEHAEKIALLANEVLGALYDGDVNAMDLLGRSVKHLTELSTIDTTLAPLAREIEQACANIDDVTRTVRSYAERVEYNPGRIEQLRHRLAELNTAKRKYRCTLTELIEKWKALRGELSGLENIDGVISTLERELEEKRATASRAAEKLSAARTKTAITLSVAVVRELKELGIQHGRFETRIDRRSYTGPPDGLFLQFGKEKVAPNDAGVDVLEFHLSTNLGEDVKPLAKVVSGGEVSRIMLALKTIFAGKNTTPVMVFDEIDVGVSGGIARKVGAAMERLSSRHQIIAISHLPQIAGAGATHFVVEKRVEAKRTLTGVRRLSADERTREIARLLSGEKITEAALQSARELIGTKG